MATRGRRGQGRRDDPGDHGRLRLREVPALGAQSGRAAVPGRLRADRGRPRGAVSLGYDVRLTMRDVVLVRARKGLRIRRRLGGQLRRRVRGPDRDRHAGVEARLGRRRPVAGRPALPLRHDAPRGVHGRAPAAAGDGAARRRRARPRPEARDRDRRHQLGPDRGDGRRRGGLQEVHLRWAEGHVAVRAAARPRLLVLLQDGDDQGPAAGAVRPSHRPRLHEGQAAGARRPRGRQRPGEPHASGLWPSTMAAR